MLSPLDRKRLDRLQQQSQPAQPKPLAGTVIGPGTSAGTIKIRLSDGGEIYARQIDNAGHALGTRLRITQQGGEYWAAGVVRL
jgi:hypothetical protein